MNDIALGIDTSCYTTSVALASAGRIVTCARRLLSVPRGERGLRQSEAVYQHVRALPELMEEMMRSAGDTKISCVCASNAPRPREDSFMPVFACGASFARAIGAALNAPVYFTTHQQGHIRAALQDSGMPDGPFVALHLSGGTTQTLLCDEKLEIQELGGTSDLNAGQLVDRTGVHMGLAFPCGPELEKLARRGTAKSLLPVSRKDLSCSFSGAEAQIKRLLEGGMPQEDAAMEVYSFLSRSIAWLVVSACRKASTPRALLAGGVASSLLLREELTRRVKKLDQDIQLYWGRPELSGDNACGVALIGASMHERG